MISTLKSLTIMLIILSVITAIIKNILPKNALNKPVNIVISLMALTCFIYPLTRADFSDWGQESNREAAAQKWESYQQKLAEAVDETESRRLERNVKNAVSAELMKHGYDYEKISVFVNKDEKTGIYISSIEITLPDKAGETEVREILKGLIDIEIKIY